MESIGNASLRALDVAAANPDQKKDVEKALRGGRLCFHVPT